jgi:hypothetical protein
VIGFKYNCLIALASPDDHSTAVQSRQFSQRCYENSEYSGKTAGELAVLPFGASPAAQDLCGERDLVR